MYNIKDLFDRRSVFSARLEQIMESQSITKAKLCKEAGISRPTLDKLLNAEITSETHFEKHVTKILNILNLTPDILMGKTHNAFNRIRQLKTALHVSEQSIAEITGISLSRLKDIEAGAKASTAELRDIALCCNTSVRGLLGTNYFDIPIALPADLTQNELFTGMTGFWGHIGIQTISNDNYLWFPINSDVRNRMHHILDQQFLVIPCMNNKVLFLNVEGINNIILLDEACDAPDFANWDSTVSDGGIPLVIYESLDDYQYMEKPDKDELSPKFQEILKALIEEKHWTEDDIMQVLNYVTIYYKNAQTLSVPCQFDERQTLTSAIQAIFDFGEFSSTNKLIHFYNLSNAQIIVNLNNVSMIELPLIAAEDIICKELEQMYEGESYEY